MNEIENLQLVEKALNEGIKEFMENITEEAKKKGYVETLFHRRRYVPELQSNNFLYRGSFH